VSKAVVYGLVSLLILTGGYVAFTAGYQERLYRSVYRLVCSAERQVTGSKRGQERKQQVMTAIHGLLPGWAKLFVSEKDLNELIEIAVQKMKESLADTSGKLPSG